VSVPQPYGAHRGLSASVCDAIIEELIDRMDSVINRISNESPAGYPAHVAVTIIPGVKQCAG
jgi:hypothetical protein